MKITMSAYLFLGSRSGGCRGGGGSRILIFIVFPAEVFVAFCSGGWRNGPVRYAVGGTSLNEQTLDKSLSSVLLGLDLVSPEEVPTPKVLLAQRRRDYMCMSTQSSVRIVEKTYQAQYTSRTTPSPPSTTPPSSLTILDPQPHPSP